MRSVYGDCERNTVIIPSDGRSANSSRARARQRFRSISVQLQRLEESLLVCSFIVLLLRDACYFYPQDEEALTNSPRSLKWSCFFYVNKP